MAKFWNGLAKALTGIALWCADHPQVVQEVVTVATKVAANETK